MIILYGIHAIYDMAYMQYIYIDGIMYYEPRKRHLAFVKWTRSYDGKL